MPTKNSGTPICWAYLETLTKSSPSVVTPVGEHDDGGQRRAAEIVEHLANGHAQLTRIVLRLGPQAVDRF